MTALKTDPPASFKSQALFSASLCGAIIKRKNTQKQAGKSGGSCAWAGASGECFQGTLAGGFSFMKDFPGAAPAGAG